MVKNRLTLRRFADFARDKNSIFRIKSCLPLSWWLPARRKRRPTRVYKHRLPGDEVIICKHPSAEPSSELVLRWLIQICLARRARLRWTAAESKSLRELIKLEHSRGLFKFLISCWKLFRDSVFYLTIAPLPEWFTPHNHHLKCYIRRPAWHRKKFNADCDRYLFRNKFSPCLVFRTKLLLTSPLSAKSPEKTQDPAVALCIKKIGCRARIWSSRGKMRRSSLVAVFQLEFHSVCLVGTLFSRQRPFFTGWLTIWCCRRDSLSF